MKSSINILFEFVTFFHKMYLFWVAKPPPHLLLKGYCPLAFLFAFPAFKCATTNQLVLLMYSFKYVDEYMKLNWESAVWKPRSHNIVIRLYKMILHLPQGPLWATLVSSSNWQAVIFNIQELGYVKPSEPQTWTG